MPACARPGVYVPRQTHDCDAAVLVRRHLPGFLARLEEAGHALPEFVKAGVPRRAGIDQTIFGISGTASCGPGPPATPCAPFTPGSLLTSKGGSLLASVEACARAQEMR